MTMKKRRTLLQAKDATHNTVQRYKLWIIQMNLYTGMNWVWSMIGMIKHDEDYVVTCINNSVRSDKIMNHTMYNFSMNEMGVKYGVHYV